MADGIAALRRDRDEVEAITTALARLHVKGSGRLAVADLRPAGDLPTYAFQTARYWPTITHAATPAAHCADRH